MLGTFRGKSDYIDRLCMLDIKISENPEKLFEDCTLIRVVR